MSAHPWRPFDMGGPYGHFDWVARQERVRDTLEAVHVASRASQRRRRAVVLLEDGRAAGSPVSFSQLKEGNVFMLTPVPGDPGEGVYLATSHPTSFRKNELGEDFMEITAIFFKNFEEFKKTTVQLK